MKLEMLLNTDIVLNDITVPLKACQSNPNFIHTGSRSVLKDLPETTDWDFMCEHTAENIEYLQANKFFPKTINVEYMDEGTDSVWVHMDHYAPDLIQVVVKKKDHWKTCIRMWQVFRDNPKLFHDYFWKSNPTGCTTMDEVRIRINAMMKFIKEGGL